MGVQSLLFAASPAELQALSSPGAALSGLEAGLLDTHLAVIDSALLNRSFEEALDALSELEAEDALLVQLAADFTGQLARTPDDRLSALALACLADDEFGGWSADETLETLQALRKYAVQATQEGRQLFLRLST